MDELDEDIWGQAYKVVVKRLGRRSHSGVGVEKEKMVVDALFP